MDEKSKIQFEANRIMANNIQQMRGGDYARTANEIMHAQVALQSAGYVIVRKTEYDPARIAAHEAARELAVQLVRDGHVDANDDAYDGVRALCQALHNQPITGKTCKLIRKIENDKNNPCNSNFII